MKKFLFAAAAITAAMFTACNPSNDDPIIDPEYAILDFESAPIYAVDAAGSNCYTTWHEAGLYTTYTDATTGLTMGVNIDDMFTDPPAPQFWSGGIVPSKFHDKETVGDANQCSVYEAGGHQSNSFGVLYAPEWSESTADLTFPANVERVAAMMWVANSTWAAKWKTPDEMTAGKMWLKMTVTGYDKTGTKTKSVEKYLVDYREEAVNKGMLTQWTPFDLVDLGKVNKLEIAISSNNPSFPNYACIDDVTFLL